MVFFDMIRFQIVKRLAFRGLLLFVRRRNLIFTLFSEQNKIGSDVIPAYAGIET